MAGCELRPYQSNALTEIKKHYANRTKKVLLHMATGGGKTVIFCQVLKGASEKKKNAIMVVRGRKLVSQASQRLDREGVEHGVLMAGHKRYKPELPIQICSIDTLRARDILPKADIIVIDEAHMATSKSYTSFLAEYPSSFILAVTATPYTEKTLRHLADTVVKPIGVQELIDQGYLVPPKYYAPSLPDLRGVKTQKTSEGKDYNTQQLSSVMEGAQLLGDIADHWLRLAKDRPTLAFCVTVEHSKKLTAYLNDRGIKAEHLDASCSDEYRQLIIKELEEGKINVICNVGILCTGVDIPSVSCIVMARPTKSLNLYIQQAGRGTRISPESGKKDFVLLDHAGNILRHGFITEEKEANLDEEQIVKKIEREVHFTICEECFAAYSGGSCPECGHVMDKPRKWTSKDGELVELKPEQLDPVKKFIEDRKKIAKDRGYKKGWVYYQVKEKFGEEIANIYFPKRFVPSWVFKRA